ncbi:efflux RND transporter permease subunit [Sporomusa malonica]|uniref:Heavy metal efflux pump, CzcA family/hydrophobe/amphiphile efflux-1 (HAE1) family protein n=1 Tax=Sporomusa malonica TaxID=112901 RepID=A0A1W2E9B7_9FIRM|nr:efflux RND transporter permease subunit [Sporomusa malonica]SMD06369.1 heavy metal efflux pump, CzcA family/hydrophobe/amphiphile efflux-1 (HAE1) family protein [Sporomusa malonica]
MIDVFIKRPVFTTMLVMLLVVFGLNAYPSLGIDLYPDVEYPLVLVNVTYTGASPEEMESLITKPIEDAVSSVAGIKTLSSVSREGVSQTTIEFELGTNPKMVANDVREKVAGVRRRLPEQIDEPVVQRYDITAQSILTFSLASDTRQRGEIRKIAEDVVKDQIQQLEGVAEVSVYGAAQREIQVLVDPRKLEAYGLTPQQLLDAVNNNNVNTPGGRVTEKGIELTVRTISKYESVDDIRNIIVLNQQGRLVRLYEVANVQDTWGEERTYAATNGVPSVVVSIQKQSGTNTVGVAEKVKQAMQHLEQNVLPPDIKVTKVRDNAVYIRNSVEDVMMSMVFGGLLAVAITFLFLRNTRATIIGAIAIPTSVISTFVLMKVMNFTLNNMSLMGLSLAVGILIDDAIVIVENIFRHMEQGKSPMEAAREGTKEISLAVMATTFSILAVFVPVGSMGEIIGQFFKQFGLTIAFAVAFSLFVAFTLTPMLSAYWLKAGHDSSGRRVRWLEALLDKWEQGFETLRENYRQILYWALQRPKKLVALAILSLFLNALLMPFLGSEFQPTYDSGEFSINMMAPAGTSIERNKELVAQVEKEVMTIPELESAYLVVGTNRQVYRSMIGIRLVESGNRSRSMMQIMDALRVKFRNVKGLKVSVSTGQSQGRGDSRPVQVALRGPELDSLNMYASTLAEKIKQIPGTTDVDISSEQSEPEVQVKFDQARLGDVGLDATTAGKAVQIAFLGSTAKNQYNVADSDYDIRVQLKQENRLSIEDVANLRVSSKNGFIRLGDIAEVKLSSGPTQIDREDRQRQVIVYANAVGTSPGEVIAKVKELVPGLNLPMGYTHKLVGQAQMMENSFKEIAKALVLAVILIYMVLAAEFESFIHPLTIMLSLPFSLLGAVLGLLVSGNTINIMSLIGVIMLMGLVTKNAILLVDYTNQLREQGTPIIDALVEAGSVRLRPILMTTMAMIFGMMPIALGIGAGAELRSSMGVALIGGLITSTFLTLIIIPLVYLLIDKLQNYFRTAKPDIAGRNPGV